MSGVDIALLVVLGLSMLAGLIRGLTLEVLSLAGWVAAYFAALWATPWLLPYMPIGAPGSALQHGVTFLAAFVVAIIVWGLCARLISLLIKSSPLQLFDRVLGGCFGAVRGVVLLLVAATAISMTPWVRSPGWQGSQGAAWLQVALGDLLPLLPPGLVKHLPARPTAAS